MHSRSYALRITHHALLDSSRNRRHDADLIAFFDRRFQVLQEANVFIVEINVYKAIELSRRLEEAGFNAGGFGLEVIEHIANTGALRFDDIGAVGVGAKGRGNANFDCHKNPGKSKRIKVVESYRELRLASNASTTAGIAGSD